MKTKRWISLVAGLAVLVAVGWVTAAEYNSPWVKTQALYLNNVLVTSTAAELNILDTVTATAAELNILDTATVTAAELNLLDDATVVVQSIRVRTTVSELNADAIILPAVAGKGYRLISFNLIPYGGGTCSALTSLELEGFQTSGVDLVSLAQASMTQSNPMIVGAAGVTILADGATYAVNDDNKALTATVTGTDAATCTGVDFILTYTLE